MEVATCTPDIKCLCHLPLCLSLPICLEMKAREMVEVKQKKKNIEGDSGTACVALTL